jgi:hypothetical protein
LNVVVLPKGVPVTVMGKMPVGVTVLVAIVSVLKQVGVQAVGENEAAAPAGSPVAAKETDCEVPEMSVAVIVFEPDEPWITVMFPR